jgi:hypothetical protein
MKRCIKCDATKSVSDFQTRKDGRISADCRECHRAYMRRHYIDNKQKYLDKAKRHRIAAHKRTIEIIWNYLATNPCVDCGESNPIVLDFDHNEPNKKLFNISDKKIFRNEKPLIDEIKKCCIRCANCHRIRTARQNGNWKYARVYPLATNELKG